MKHKLKKIHPVCPYCGKTAVLRDASYVHKNRAFGKLLYVCSGYPKCNSYVGVHNGSTRPKGTLANGDLRHKRIETHRIFDELWKKGIFSKDDAYRWMQDILSLSRTQAHIANFSEYRCDCLINECRKVLENNHIQLA